MSWRWEIDFGTRCFSLQRSALYSVHDRSLLPSQAKLDGPCCAPDGALLVRSAMATRARVCLQHLRVQMILQTPGKTLSDPPLCTYCPDPDDLR